MTLKELRPGDQARVTKIAATGALKRRIMDMGLTKGCELTVRKLAPLGDPMEINLRGYELTLRKQECDAIQVEKI
ncbi:ferrous iron transport protein A [Erysipelotrichaceae bacterium RD49]|nr:ferrous iron transport protein A [Erysipelotrichaceae bacterium RD49]